MASRLARTGSAPAPPERANEQPADVRSLLANAVASAQQTAAILSRLASLLDGHGHHPETDRLQVSPGQPSDGSGTAAPLPQASTLLKGATRDMRPKKKVDPTKLSGSRRLVLRAIAHYEAVAPRSIIDVQAIRMYIEEYHAAALAQYSTNILSNAVHALRTLGLIRVHVGKDNRWRQYRLTAAGKRCIKVLDTMTPQPRQKEK